MRKTAPPGHHGGLAEERILCEVVWHSRLKSLPAVGILHMSLHLGPGSFLSNSTFCYCLGKATEDDPSISTVAPTGEIWVLLSCHTCIFSNSFDFPLHLCDPEIKNKQTNKTKKNILFTLSGRCSGRGEKQLGTWKFHVGMPGSCSGSSIFFILTKIYCIYFKLEMIKTGRNKNR